MKKSEVTTARATLREELGADMGAEGLFALTIDMMNFEHASYHPGHICKPSAARVIAYLLRYNVYFALGIFLGIPAHFRGFTLPVLTSRRPNKS